MPHDLAINAFGVRLAVDFFSLEIEASIVERLPPTWGAGDMEPPHRRYQIHPSDDDVDTWELWTDGALTARYATMDHLLDDLESDMQMYVAEFASPQLFIHAGVVGWNGAAIVLPGRSFAGKSTLVTSLVQAGAEYYSDEYAVLDERGMVWPYWRRVSLRNGPHGPARRLDLTPDAAPEAPLPISLVALLRYEPGGTWDVPRRTPAEALMRLADQTVAIQRRPKDTLAYLGRVVETATVIEGTRGEVEDAVWRLLEAAELVNMRPADIALA